MSSRSKPAPLQIGIPLPYGRGSVGSGAGEQQEDVPYEQPIEGSAAAD